MDEALVLRYNGIIDLAEEIRRRLQHEVDKLGFDESEVSLKSPTDAHYRLEKDPASCEYSLVGDWRDTAGFKMGTLLFHADGSFFVEHDVVKPHPSNKRWFVEAVNAWGRGTEIKAEARLLPVV
ncbi:MAG: hypothetical protein AB2807_02285 [Candidatus Sedimenticola endophacoides]